ncbi:LacI family DNA-binding transcriptional regulator [Lentilactobacillus parabuchneri]|jgi:LacI family transcriptional regulator|uniref:HTH-type transcriptional regulator LacR n=2 Tax=Lentilactobacillus parabuchneri TaxID=152331 RepID=A0A1X1FF81_9LACO|nr:LacI family DNA-binding transcriptional regulator [Lentilactobacillus parabuchneri]APR07518.1 HTH-type transcriptional regulator LacR [Lentilactobacillus parabuchneri]KRM46282.1 lacI family transcriptional regulator [Lentilactobacillus parabuchneri DSM 5707 = NBRC 107865]KRN72933.1 lacI family transcriptional regulator [Lentilactobacillus parabuchneri]MBW0223000.1 LacI family DNA-binding transcriptional regulator [Lentilactobacillus parabuchneri]MBW0245896.1 LacI family DNA-binding transcri
MATIKDIARKAGVSITTVSRVLNYDKSLSVSDLTRKKIFQAAEALDYTKKKRSSTTRDSIAVVQWYTEQQELDDLYYLSIRMGVEKQAERDHYKVKRYFAGDSLTAIDDVKGIVAIGKFSDDQIAEMQEVTDNVVFVDFDTLAKGHDCVVTDFDNSTKSVLNYFIENGLKRIGMISGVEYSNDHKLKITDHRFDVFKNFLEKKSLFDPANVFVGDYTLQSSYNLVDQALKRSRESFPNALFVSNDAMAVGALKALHEHGVKVPDDVSLVSFNDTAVAKYVIPSLTAIKVYTNKMGEVAVRLLDLLDNNLDGDVHTPEKVVVATHLVERESVRKS